MNIIFGYMSTKRNNEDFAITPYLSGVWFMGNQIRVVGLGLTWGWASVHVSIGTGFPASYPTFSITGQNKPS